MGTSAPCSPRTCLIALSPRTNILPLECTHERARKHRNTKRNGFAFIVLLLSLSSRTRLALVTVIFPSSCLSSSRTSLTAFSINSFQLLLTFAVLHSPPQYSRQISFKKNYYQSFINRFVNKICRIHKRFP